MNVSFWYLLVGILFANGMMHFVIGLSGHRFLSWFGKAANANVAWGVSNVFGATGLVVWRCSLSEVIMVNSRFLDSLYFCRGRNKKSTAIIELIDRC